MTPARMAALHATAFEGAARWSVAAFAATLAEPSTFLLDRPDAFLLGRVVADEAELLTLVVAGSGRRKGTARALLAGFDDAARARGATAAFLEVADDNAPARALYAATGWAEAGHRHGYYAGTDALILRKPL